MEYRLHFEAQKLLRDWFRKDCGEKKASALVKGCFERGPTSEARTAPFEASP
jgi:hypothetical protein